MSWAGAIGAKGLCSEGFVVVPEECKYCKLDRFKTKEQATGFLKENHHIRNIIIITEEEYVDAWNKRFANFIMNGKGATSEVGPVGGCCGTGIDWSNVKPK